ncbi:hypothetical protein GQE99_10450 [Maritimibacter sp. DP07]|uniref:Acyl-CoA thioester hydrolase n=1 Tax=Maritimibacter harenae TaxID=2606218 RepID=A0A845M1I7_9RHOB|nr:thioesterase family protein [Maritimibacter harenae]MZR13436.1 hypothetical protein [Maritimibacter harenae]
MTMRTRSNFLKGDPRQLKFSVSPEWSYGIGVEAAWSDLDKLGHVTNSAFWRWSDDVRVQYVIDMGLPVPARDAPSVVVVQAAGEFHKAMEYRQVGLMTCRTTRLGNSSFDTEHALWLESGKAFTATFTLVLSNISIGGSIQLPIAFKERIAALDGL